jgi:dihydroceramidase
MTGQNRALLTGVVSLMWIGVAFEALYLLGPDWAAFAPATCLATHCFCEAPRTGELLLQPANSWSSFGFVVVGAWIMLGAASRPDSAFNGLPVLWYGLTAIIIGVGSVMLHATLTLWGQFADVLGMYLLGAFTLVWSVKRWRGLGASAAVLLYVLVAGALVASLWLWPETRRWLFAVLLVVAVGIEWGLARPRRDGVRRELLLLGLAANLLAFAIWILDQTRAVCAPESLWQGHAAWHLLGAVAVAFSFAYYRSETAGTSRVRARGSL